MNILVKYPSRQRPNQFVRALNRAIENQTTGNVHYLLTLDSDDKSMVDVISAVEGHDFITIDIGTSKSKINACNRGIDAYTGKWDIVVLLSDDMICQYKGWDAKLIEEMETHYPDTDGVLFHNDGFLGRKLNTMCILGHTYYNRFGYIYQPEYKSFWSDNEFMIVADELGKQTYFEDVLFKHEHPANTGGENDSLYMENNANFVIDKQLFDERKQQGFPIIIGANTND
jgi:hypothetical protein